MIVETKLHTRIVPLRRDLATTHGPLGNMREIVIVELISDDGLSGFGEASTLPGFVGETADTVRLVLEKDLLPRIRELEPFEIGHAHVLMDSSLKDHTCAKAAIDEAMYDLLGKQLGIPVHALLGGAQRKQLSTSFDVGIADPAKMAEQAQAGVQSGVKTIKVKLRGDINKDQTAVRAIREAIGPDTSLWLDANEGYRSHEAVQLIRKLNNCNIMYVEQPVPRWDIDGLCFVKNCIDIPVIADESVFSAQDAIRLVKAEAADLFVLKLIKCGGIYRARQIAAIAEAAGINCVMIQTIESGIGTSAATHFAISLANAAPVHGLNNLQFLEDEPAPGLVIKEWEISPGDSPGLGVVLIDE